MTQNESWESASLRYLNVDGKKASLDKNGRLIIELGPLTGEEKKRIEQVLYTPIGPRPKPICMVLNLKCEYTDQRIDFETRTVDFDDLP